MWLQDNYPVRLRAESISLSAVLCVFIISMSLGAGNGHNNELGAGYASASRPLVGPPMPSNADGNEYLCKDSDYPVGLPVFTLKQTICNVDSVPVDVYEIRCIAATVDQSKQYEYKYCIQGDRAKEFIIDNQAEPNMLKLINQLNQTETVLRLQIIRIDKDGGPSDRRQAINGIQISLLVRDCNRVSWQTVAVAILSSICVVLLSTTAIMLILYQQKGLFMGNKDDDGDEYDSSTGANLGRSPHQLDRPPDHANDESFINPRRTSSYDFSAIAKAHNDAISERQMETENL